MAKPNFLRAVVVHDLSMESGLRWLNWPPDHVMRAIAFAAILLLVPQREAASFDLHILGFGNTSCGTWARDHQGVPDAAGMLEESWVFGYVAAFSSFALAMGAPNPSGVVDAGGLIQWVSNYCVAHPLDTIYEASDALTAELMQRATKH